MKKKIQAKPTTGSSKSGKVAKKQKQPTQYTPQLRVLVLGPTGKRRLEWVDR